MGLVLCPAVFLSSSHSPFLHMISSKVHARVGVLGNPSDGYGGCCISCLVNEFAAAVTLMPDSHGISLMAPDGKRWEYGSLKEMSSQLESGGYGGDGGVQLLSAMVNRFYSYCLDHSITLDGSGFRIAYATDIPRQVGLSGSSAICTAALNCLMDHFAVSIPIEERPELIRSAETKELGIVAGLQDRVVQSYGHPMIYMDFSVIPHAYERIDPDPQIIDKMFIMYSEDLSSDSGKIHSDVKHRWEQGDEDVRAGMMELAGLARTGRDILMDGGEVPPEVSLRQLGKLMDRNFDIRRRLFGDEVLGDRNLRMIELARSYGAAAKMTGSGGCALVLDLDDKAHLLLHEAILEGFTLKHLKLPAS